MNHRDRIMKAMRRERPDRVPYGIHLTAPMYRQLVERTGQADAYAYFDLAYRHVSVKTPRSLPDFSRYFAGRAPDWQDLSRSDATLTPHYVNAAYFCMGEHNTAMNEWGEYRVYGEGDYHSKIFPLASADCTVADVQSYPFPDVWAEYRYDGIKEEIARIQGQGFAAVLPFEQTIFEKAWRIRGLQELIMDLVASPEFCECLFDEIARRTGYMAMRYAQAGVDIIQLGDDVGSERGMLFNPSIWRAMLKPRMTAIIAGIKQANPKTLVFYHCDGAFEAIIPDLIEIGVEILNPVQPEAMNVVELKKQFGKHLSFWGGLGTQSTMPFGTADDVQAHVKQLIEDVGEGGGLLVSPSHLVEPDVPWQNIDAFINAMQRYGAYA